MISPVPVEFSVSAPLHRLLLIFERSIPASYLTSYGAPVKTLLQYIGIGNGFSTNSQSPSILGQLY